MPFVEKWGGLGAVALFWAAGWGWCEILPVFRRFRFAPRQACAYLLGLGWVAGALYVLSHLFAVPLRRPAIVALSLLPILAGGIMSWRGRRSSRGVRRPASRRNAFRPVPILALGAASLVTLAIVGEVVTQPLRDWDGRMTWSLRAKIFRAEGTVDADALRGAEWFVSHPSYPSLLPVAQVAALELVGAGDDDPAPRLLYAAFYPTFLMLLWGGVRSRASAEAAGFTVLAASLLPFLAFFPGGGANSSYSDLPLACFYGAALLLLLRRRISLSAGAAAGALLACAVLTKEEGTPLALAALGIAGVWQAFEGIRRLRRGRPRGAAPTGFHPWNSFLIATGLALSAWIFLASWRSGIPNRYSDDYRAMLAHQTFGGALSRIPEILGGIGSETFALRHWGLFWIVGPLVVIAGLAGKRKPGVEAHLLAFAAPLALGFLAYLITDKPGDLPRMTWSRFLVQGAVPFFTLFGWALGDLLRGSPLPPLLGGSGWRGSSAARRGGD